MKKARGVERLQRATKMSFRNFKKIIIEEGYQYKRSSQNAHELWTHPITNDILLIPTNKNIVEYPIVAKLVQQIKKNKKALNDN